MKTYLKSMNRYLLASGLVLSALGMLVLHVPTASAAAYCVTNPYGKDGNYFSPTNDTRCDVTVSMSPVSTSLPYGGNTNITLTAESFFQYGVGYSDFFAVMSEDVTGTATSLSYSGGIPTGNRQTRVTNTGSLKKSVTVYLCGVGNQPYLGKTFVTSCVSSHITVAPAPLPPTVDLKFSFLNTIKDSLTRFFLVQG